MELEIKIADLEEAIERYQNNGRKFNSFEEELEYVNQKYQTQYMKYCADKEQEWFNTDEYVPDDANIFERMKARFNHFKNLVKRIFEGDIYAEEDEWVIPYDNINDTMRVTVHIPIKEWNRLKKKWKVA